MSLASPPLRNPAASAVTVEGFEIPTRALLDLDGFRDWVASLPERAPRVHFGGGRVHVEVSPQSYKTHGPVENAINDALAALTGELALGRWFRPPSWITHEASGLSTEPDGFLVLAEALRTSVRLNPERDTELLGRPDVAVEVVSKSSAKKDLVDLVHDYARAGTREYWIADARTSPPALRILILGADGAYRDEAPDRDGCLASPTFGRRFRLVHRIDAYGWPCYELEALPLASA